MTSQGSGLIAVAICFLVLAFATVVLRCYVRIRLSRGFRVDDALSVATLIFFILGSVCLLIGVETGSFGHMWTQLSEQKLVAGLKLLFIYEMAYITGTCMVKLSISMFLLRFTVERKYTWILYGVLTIILTYSIFLLLFAVFQCDPVSAFWDPRGHCNRTGVVKVTYAHSAIVSATDWTLSILPIFICQRCHLGKVCICSRSL
ncbi:hypothetical protein BJX70DRAFT_361809 [Aspergillus crustosus]